jgi:hypothetical protein
MAKSVLLGAALALTVTSVWAAGMDVDSANYMMPGCRDWLGDAAANLFRQGRCAGVIEGLIYLNGGACRPEGSTREQSVRVVVAYIDARPAQMHERFDDLALEALRAAWPCK